MNDHVQQIKDRLSIVDVVSSYVKLEKAGVNFRARCPFHNEKTPSFFVSPSRNTYHCFGCGEGGDIFSFVERFEGADFRGALKMLAERAGIELTPVDPKREDERARLWSALEAATTYFEAMRNTNAAVDEYLHERGLSQETIAAWRIGYAPPAWRDTLEHLESKGYTKAELLRVGLIKQAEGKQDTYYDRFRGRIIFPITDSSGRVIAYTGRIFPHADNPEYKEDTAKYLNSPETSLFDKSRTLFGYSYAKLSIRRMNFSILVEGQMDVIMAHQAGYTNTVAASGTALTSDQLALLGRLSNNLVMAFDADQAGVAAQGKGIDVALGRGMDVKVAALPRGEDPADLIHRDKDAWRLAVKNAKHVINFYLDHLEAEYTDERKLRVEVGNRVIPYIARIPHRIDQAHFVSETAKRLGISETPIWESIREKKAPPNPREQAAEGASMQQSKPQETRGERILTFLLALLRAEEARDASAQSIDVGALRRALESALGEEEVRTRMEQSEMHGDAVLYEIETVYESEDIKKIVEQMMSEWKQVFLKQQYEEALRALRAAEAKGSTDAVEAALARCRELSAAIRDT